MTASLAWIDYDARAHQRSQRILALFAERETRDELGLGGIRDALSDALFPGTSTIQTRLGYMLFVPWMYRALEDRHVSAARVARLGRDYELRLSRALIEAADERERGIFGREAGKGLQRLPSSVYWAGLKEWGIRLYPGSQQQYHTELDRIYARRRRSAQTRDAAQEVGDDVGGLWEAGTHTWHPGIPDAPEGFPDEAGFALTRDQARFLQEQIKQTHPESLLAHLVYRPGQMRSAYPWEHPEYASFHPGHRALLRHAESFSLAMHGASLLYNLMLAEKRENAGQVEGYRERLDRWERQLGDSAGDFTAWAADLRPFWEGVMGRGHAIGQLTQDFVRAWVNIVVREGGPVGDHPEARELVRQREQFKKKANSRFTNQRALDQWGGASGADRLTFRWPTVLSFLADFRVALSGDVNA